MLAAANRRIRIHQAVHSGSSSGPIGERKGSSSSTISPRRSRQTLNSLLWSLPSRRGAFLDSTTSSSSWMYTSPYESGPCSETQRSYASAEGSVPRWLREEENWRIPLSLFMCRRKCQSRSGGSKSARKDSNWSKWSSSAISIEWSAVSSATDRSASSRSCTSRRASRGRSNSHPPVRYEHRLPSDEIQSQDASVDGSLQLGS